MRIIFLLPSLLSRELVSLELQKSNVLHGFDMTVPRSVVMEAQELLDACPVEAFTIREFCSGDVLFGDCFKLALPWITSTDVITKVFVEGELTPEFVAFFECEDSEKLVRRGLVPGRMLPMFAHYGVEAGRSAIIASGSWLYGLNDESSDYDLRVVSEAVPSKQSTEILGPAAVTFLSIENFAHGLATGSRHAWELARAPASCRSSGGIWDQVTTMADHAWKRVPPGGFLKASARYISRYAGALTGPPVHEADVNFRRWKIRRGWAYKLGYYMLIDVLYAANAEKGDTDPSKIFSERPELKPVVLRCKKGDMTFEEWRSLFSLVAHQKAEEALCRCLSTSS